MLKKRNIAMVMAATTIVANAVPAFAAVEEVTTTNDAKLLEEVERLLNTKYSDKKETGIEGQSVTAGNEYRNSVYAITYSVNGGASQDLKDVEMLSKLIENAKLDPTNAKFELVIVDKGHRVDGDEIVAVETNEYKKVDATYINSLADIADVADITNKVTTLGSESVTIDFKNVDLDDIVLTADDYQLDLSKPVDAEGNIVSLPVADVNTGKKVVGFKTLETGLEKEHSIPSKKLAEVKYDATNAKYKQTVDASAIKDENGYTEEGAELTNILVKANDSTVTGTNTVDIVKDGSTYQINFNASNEVADVDALTTKATGISKVTVSKDGGYEFAVKLTTQKYPTNKNVIKEYTIVIKDASQSKLTSLRNAMLKTDAATDLVEAFKNEKFATLAGDDRFATAVEVSKKAYDKFDAKNPVRTADSVVLVGENAIVDGLAAAPLAAEKNAPILLAKKDVVTEETMNEIKRVIDKDSTIYIVGGENTISEEVEKQLIEEMNANIVRLAGDDRYETSVKIASELDLTGVTKAFVVGGEGLADAMSIAAFASQDVNNVENGVQASPIIVVPQNKLGKDATMFFGTDGDGKNMTHVDIIGGESNVSTGVLKTLSATSGLNKAVNRIAGSDRTETNAKVIDTYYQTNSVSDIFVSKDGYGNQGQLVDTLAAAPLAGYKKSPIVLATNSLSDEQVKVINDVKTSTTSLTQVGNGIASTVMDKIVKLLGL